jgi:hypothetical protein
MNNESNPSQDGEYLVFYLPFGQYNLGRWRFAAWTLTERRWSFWGETDSSWKITHWTEKPPIPPENECLGVLPLSEKRY